MYLLYYAAIGTVNKRERRKRSDNVLVKLCSHRYCKERKKRRDERDNVLAIICGHRESYVTVLEVCRLWYENVRTNNDDVSLIDSSVLKCFTKMNRCKKQATCIVVVVQYSNSLCL